MTITTRQTVVDMLKALGRGEGTEHTYAVYEYQSRTTNRTAWAVFTDRRHDDLAAGANEYVRRSHPLWIDGRQVRWPYLPPEPEPDWLLQARFTRALERRWSMPADVTRELPGHLREHVFDTEDCWRLIVSVDAGHGVTVLHASASRNLPDGTCTDEQAPTPTAEDVVGLLLRVGGGAMEGVYEAFSVTSGVMNLLYPLEV